MSIKKRPNSLLCKYAYKHGEETHTSQCLLTIKTFFQKQRGCASLSWDKTLSLAVLKYKQIHIAGNQAIEHYLLQFKKDIKVSYEKASPELSFPDELQARRVPQEPKVHIKKDFSTLFYPLLILLFFFSFTRAQFAQPNSKKNAELFLKAGAAESNSNQNDTNIEGEEPKEYRQALDFYLKAKFQDSLEKIRSIFEEHKNRMSLRILAAANYIALGKSSQAMSHIQAARRIHPQRFEPRLFYIRILRAQKKYYEAIAAARRAIQDIGEAPGLFLEIAAVYYELQSYPKARAQLQRALELDPQNYYAFYLDGLLFLQEGRYELAEFRLRNALALKPKHKEDLKLVYNNLALALEKKRGKSGKKS